jgi:hypothetical protein
LVSTDRGQTNFFGFESFNVRQILSNASTLVLLLHLMYVSYLSYVYRACSLYEPVLQALRQRLERNVKSHVDVVDQLEKIKDENDDLKFQVCGSS